jgi:hypothetical protein
MSRGVGAMLPGVWGRGRGGGESRLQTTAFYGFIDQSAGDHGIVRWD